MMLRKGLVIGIDLGTSASTASYCLTLDSLDSQGKLNRKKASEVHDVKDWPASNIHNAIGNPCLPTDLIYRKDLRTILYWGFEAQQYLDSTFPEPSRDEVFIVENIKLLLPGPNAVATSSTASERYRSKRETLINTLSKQPEDVFEDFMSLQLNHVIGSAMGKYYSGLNNLQIELVLAFPSGWEDIVHTNVARIGNRAMKKALSDHKLENVIFGLEHVYTVSETICGVKEWLRETVSEFSAVEDSDSLRTNLDELQDGDCFLPVDIGGGTGCLTPLKLISKRPLAVEQLDRTQSLEVSGEAVEAEFERWLRPQIIKTYYPGDIPRLVNRICRMFKEEKKRCGLTSAPGSTWSFEVTKLKVNLRRGWEKGCMRIKREDLDKQFDPAIKVLEEEIRKILVRFPSIKAIIFLGQFGGSSAYLKKKMQRSPIAEQVKIRHSQSGKLDVVKGAISERLTLDERFVRQYKTSKSYGTLVTLIYSGAVKRLFPNPQQQGAVPFEESDDGPRLKVIEWAIPKGTMIQNSRSGSIGKDGCRYHTWPVSEKDIGFEDIIVVSDECTPKPQLDKTSYTLWTTAHERDNLHINGERIRVQQIPFGWDLSMSQKVDSRGNVLGPYCEADLGCIMSSRGKRPPQDRQRVLYYDLIWDITEMQVKIYVQAQFPNLVGPLTSQLAIEKVFDQDEKTAATESRSTALEKDIQLTHNGLLEEHEGPLRDKDISDETNRPLNGMLGAGEFQQIGNALVTEPPRDEGMPQQAMELDQEHPAGHNEVFSTQQQVLAPFGSRPTFTAANQQQSNEHFPVIGVAGGSQQLPGGQTEENLNQEIRHGDKVVKDRRRRNGCFTCKDRKKKCDCIYAYDQVTRTTKCTACRKHNIRCDLEQPPEWLANPMQKQAEKLERKRLVRLGKRKSTAESDSSDVVRHRSFTLPSEEDINSRPAVYPSIEKPV